jgi:biopolymer transport protein ExbD
MRIKDPLSEGEEPYNLVPLTDMVFNLLIFFMCATTFAQVEKDMAVQLPHTSPFTPISAPPQQLIINIKQDGSTVVDGKIYDSTSLSALVGDVMRQRASTAVLIRADERSIMRYFAGVARICKRAGVSETHIVYVEESSPGS